MSLDGFKDTRPIFLPEQFFWGRVQGWVVVESLLGGLQKRATISGEGVWESGAGTLTFSETYRFDDGHTDTFNWLIRKDSEGLYSGTESRVQSQAKGEQSGCAFHWQYSRDTPQQDGSSFVLHFDDWFYAIDEHACIVRASIGRAGLPFATAHVTYRRI
jgi:hypothetical protein